MCKKSTLISSSPLNSCENLNFTCHFSDSFFDLENILKEFQQENFLALSLKNRFKQVNQTLCDLIQQAFSPAYLLSAVLDFFDRLNQIKILNEPLDFAAFEFWLNHFSDLNDQENYAIRAKVVGKKVNREEYQIFFPIGMNRIYSGPHFVAAHLSPDVDTMIASFWGWLDAFGARVAKGLHLWSLPGGAPHSPFTSIFRDLLGKNLFFSSAYTVQTLNLTARDLVTQKDFHKKSVKALTSNSSYQATSQAVILVNEHGHYLGEELPASVSRNPPVYLTLSSEVEEIFLKMEHRHFLTVVIPEKDGSLFPIGVVWEKDLKRAKLGTVTFRDFSSQEEVKMSPYLEVISVIDHHKSALKTLSVSCALIGDTQSCNTLLAEQAFKLNDKYSLGGLSAEQIEEQIQQVLHHLPSPIQTRLLQKLLQRRLAAQTKTHFYIHPKREFQEYLSFLYAIIDDTDLLTKVSLRDVECVAQLLNRLKSLSLQQEVEIIHFDDLVKDHQFVKLAAQKILKQQDMYFLYRKIYMLREEEVESNLSLCLKGKPSNIFLDTKEQNGCARVGQTKIFASNFSYFSLNAFKIQTIWLTQSQTVNQMNPLLDLHLHMISTIASAEEVYKNQLGSYLHLDEIWFWIPPSALAEAHLVAFLSGFQTVTKEMEGGVFLEFMGSEVEYYKKIFNKYYSDSVQKTTASPHAVNFVIMRFKAGSLNSRKSMISPFLPRVIP